MVHDETYEQRLMRARSFDAGDELAVFRNEFHLPKQENGEPTLYFVGNSLGLQPKRTESYIAEELTKWRELGVRGHFECERPWMPYHEFLSETMAELVGAQPNEVVMMNSLTTNLHLMLATFYRANANTTQNTDRGSRLSVGFSGRQFASGVEWF